MNNSINSRKIESIYKGVMTVLLAGIALLCVAPMVLTLSVSFSDEQDLIRNGYSFIPRIFSFASYEFLFKNPGAILTSYWVTIRVVTFGTVLGTLFMSMAAFPLSRRDFIFRKPITFYIFFTMLFSGGLVPLYMVVTRFLHLQDTLFVLFLPIMVTAWNTLLLITYFRSIPLEMIESAKVDGADEFVIFFRIIVPVGKPALATISLLLSLRLWNEWFTALLFIRDSALVPLQFWMQRVMTNIEFLLMNQDRMGGGATAVFDIPTEGVRMAMAVLAAGPMMFVFPFFQKYFARGLQVGAVKG